MNMNHLPSSGSVISLDISKCGLKSHPKKSVVITRGVLSHRMLETQQISLPIAYAR